MWLRATDDVGEIASLMCLDKYQPAGSRIVSQTYFDLLSHSYAFSLISASFIPHSIFCGTL
jgi:hypothetical protein